jgi:hypothetical protein
VKVLSYSAGASIERQPEEGMHLLGETLSLLVRQKIPGLGCLNGRRVRGFCKLCILWETFANGDFLF